jgi:hypothetical protein
MLADAIADNEQAIDAERHGWSQFLLCARAQLAWALIPSPFLLPWRSRMALAAARLGNTERPRLYSMTSSRG